MLKELQVIEFRNTTIAQIENLKGVKNHFIESKEFELARSTEEKIRRYQRDVKILNRILENNGDDHKGSGNE